MAIDRKQFPRWSKARIDPSIMEAGHLTAGDVLMLENPKLRRKAAVMLDPPLDHEKGWGTISLGENVNKYLGVGLESMVVAQKVPASPATSLVLMPMKMGLWVKHQAHLSKFFENVPIQRKDLLRVNLPLEENRFLGEMLTVSVVDFKPDDAGVVVVQKTTHISVVPLEARILEFLGEMLDRWDTTPPDQRPGTRKTFLDDTMRAFIDEFGIVNFGT